MRLPVLAVLTAVPVLLLGVPLGGAAGAAGTAATAAAAATAAGPDVPPAQRLTARSVLPPGESGFYGAAGQARGTVTKVPADYGTHVDDQRDLYWSFGTKPAPFSAVGTALSPKVGVRIYRDEAGVPSVFGDTGRDVWFGAGYSAAVDRLFEMDAIRRTAEGTLAELTGPKQVPKDLAVRVTGYTPAEYDAMLAGLSPEGRDALEGYAAGVQARIAEVTADPSQLPAEYALLTSLPAPWTTRDSLAAGVYITRFVATQGGNELDNVAALKSLEQKLGTTAGRRAFQDLYSDEDPKAAVTIASPAFSNLPVADRTPARREAAFQAMADYAETVPAELATGIGTGAAPVPVTPPAPTTSTPPLVAASVLRAADSLSAWAAHLHGGSYAFAVAGSRTRDHGALLQSSPQLDYSYPGLLWELQVHGGGYDARGVSVPGIPTVGIGWTGSTAWGLTTGYSKNIDSFIETTRPNPTAGGPPQYRHDGAWVDESCRTETVAYRQAAMGVPAGPPAFSSAYQVCRTVHGPVVATTADGTRARSVSYAQFGHDVDTVEGILLWDRAKTLADIEAGVAKVAWNENIVAADADGNIGYWHPGRYPVRAPGTDQRFPTPGDGSYDSKGLLPFDQMPHVVNPPEGFVANWNTKPAHGWVDGDLSGTATRPGGPANRVVRIQSLLGSRTDLTGADLPALDAAIGNDDHRAAGYLPLVTALRGTPLSPQQAAAVDLLSGWDGRAYAPGAPGGSSPLGTPATAVTDGPAATLFAELVLRLRAQLFSDLPPAVLDFLTHVQKESHLYDAAPLDNLVLRTLRPGYSGLAPSVDRTGGRTPSEVVRSALDQAVAALTETYGADPAGWRRPHGLSHLDSLTGVIGPSGVTMPFEDRGSWMHQVTFEARPAVVGTLPVTPPPAAAPAPVAAVPARPAPPRRPTTRPVRRPATFPPGRPVVQPGRTLAFTGGLPLAGLGVLLPVLVLVVRRRRRTAG